MAAERTAHIPDREAPPLVVPEHHFWQLARTAGLSRSRLLALAGSCGIALADGNSHTARLRLSDYFRMLDRLALELDDETCRLASKPLIPGATHFAWSTVLDAPDFAAAMRRVAEAYNMLHGGHYNHVEEGGGWLRYVIDDRHFPYAPGQDREHIVFALECVLVFLHGSFLLLTGDRAGSRLRRIWSRRPSPPSGPGALAFLDAPVRWAAPVYALIYDAEAGALPLARSRDAIPAPRAVYRKLVALIARWERWPIASSLAERVADLLVDHPGSRQPEVARRLGMSVATLRRRLSEGGTSFRRIRRRVLQEEAMRMLRAGRSLPEIADALSYADFRSFSRAFKAAAGLSPAV
ncbi:MAG: hypothetical protein KatS3mg082_2436 [Nitrospiraceae bacterium]|nr:MAG: hypothetical protein KatS3mg082_2436 [Nitrospiraceae bacterium]